MASKDIKESYPKRKKIGFLPTGPIAMIAGTGLLLVEAVFALLLFKLDLLPVKYLIPVIVTLVLIFVGAILLLSGARRSARRLVGFIVSVAVMCVLLLGSSYLFSTYAAFDSISDIAKSYDIYNVVVLDSSECENAGDLEGKTVYTIKSDKKTYLEAQGNLKGKATVEYKQVDDAMAAGEKLVERNGSTHDETILVSRANYQLYCEDIDGFKEKTRVLYRIKIEADDSNSGDIDVTRDSFNVYISGIDVWGNINERVSRSDVNMIATVNPKTRQVLLTSIPRDAYVELHSSGQLDKLTHSGVYGIDETTGTVEDWLGIDMNYYVRANFGMIIKLVNAVDGVDVYSKYDFKSAISEYEYHKGWNHLKGRAALYFARERKSFEDNDQERIKNQQKVVKAVLKKMTSSTVILTSYTDILDAVKKNMQTDMSSKEISSLVKMQLDDMDTKWTINMNSIRGTMDKKGTYSMGFGRPLDVCIMDQKSVDKAVKLINSVMYPEGSKAVEIKDDKSTKGLKKDN